MNWRNLLLFLKNAGTSRFVSKKPEQFEKQVFLCCLVSSFVKTVDVYCIFINNIDHFRPFRSF